MDLPTVGRITSRQSHFALDEKRIKAEARYDGIWVLRTNTNYNAETVAHVYKNLRTVEDIFRTTKSILETRPIYHKRDETIRGHVLQFPGLTAQTGVGKPDETSRLCNGNGRR